jgi:hypothetical protein
MRVVLLLLFGVFWGFAQPKNPFALVEAKMNKIPKQSTLTPDALASYVNANFKTENDKVRAVFYWIATNISYDIEKIDAVNYAESTPDKIKNTLLTQKGVCIHYAELFNDIIQRLEFNSYIIYGYTKQNGKIDTLSHSWCAVKTEGNWWLYDPTWAAGYVNNKKFFKKLNNQYYKVSPSQFISSHMPFDYLWQFSNYPINNQQFVEGKIQLDKTKPKFDYVAQLEQYNQLSELDKVFITLKRVENNGVINPLIQQMVLSLKSNLEALQNNDAMFRYNAILNDYNSAISLFNDFIYYRNNKFKPVISDEDLMNMINNPKKKFIDCQNRIYPIGKFNNTNSESVNSLKKALIDVLKQVEIHEKFVKDYLMKTKSGRKAMFSNTTFFGIPIQ